MELKGKVAIITGAGGGIGMQIAKDLANQGCDLLLCEVSGEKLEEAESQLKNTKAKYELLEIDLNELKNINKIIDCVKSSYGKVDILINCAGVLFRDGIFGVTEEQWDLSMNINLKATFFLDQKILELMRGNDDGYIIDISSCVATDIPSEYTSYGISKLGVTGISQALYKEAKKHNIRVTTILPGMTDTPMLREANTGTGPDQWMLPKDLSDLVLYLLKSSKRVAIREVMPLSAKQIIL